MHKPHIILGIDPGTTIGYAVIDLNGKLLASGSGKEFSLGDIIQKAIPHGKPLAIGTDKAKAPGLIQEIAAKTGAKIIVPAEDLKVEEKRLMTLQDPARNAHEQDAVACARYCHQTLKPLLERIKKALDKDNKQTLFDDVVELVIKHEDFSIQSAIPLPEQPHTAPLVKKVIEQRQITEKDLAKAYEEISTLRKDTKKLGEYVRHLEKLKELRKEVKQPQIQAPQRVQYILSQKEQRIQMLAAQLKSKDTVIQHKDMKIRQLKHLLEESDR